MHPKLARPIRSTDLDKIVALPQQLGSTTIGSRSIALCSPIHSNKTIRAAFETFPEGAFLSEDSGDIIGFGFAVKTTKQKVLRSHKWSRITEKNQSLAHHEDGNWLYVTRLLLTAGPGHAHLSRELNPLLEAFKVLTRKHSLAGVAFAAPFFGFRERSGTTAFQRKTIEDRNSQERSGLRPIGCSVSVGFEHEIALPNYQDDGRHFALMVWRNDDVN